MMLMTANDPGSDSSQDESQPQPKAGHSPHGHRPHKTSASPGKTSSKPSSPSSISRINSQNQGKPKGPTRHPEFWLHDGSVILIVEDVAFKVHQTILAVHSEVFADLFSVPQPPIPQVTRSGFGEDEGEGNGSDQDEEPAKGPEPLPTIHLPDSAPDFLSLLRAIYHPSHFSTLPPHADLDTLLVFISGILRLSTKYLIRELRKRCITLLTARFPTTYHEYLHRPHPAAPPPPTGPLGLAYSTSETPPASAPSTPGAPPPPPLREKERSKHKASAIMRAMRLAHDTNVPLILPYASYLLARSSPHRLLSPPPSSPPPSPSPSSTPHTTAPSTDSPTSTPDSLPTISWHQRTITLIGREHLRIAEMSLTHAFLLAFRPSPTCLAPGFCANARGPHAEWHVLESGGELEHDVGGGGLGGAGGTGTGGTGPGEGRGRSRKRGRRGPNPLRGYERWERMNVCAECVREKRAEHERGREEVWERLPGFFGMGAWEELRAGQERW